MLFRRSRQSRLLTLALAVLYAGLLVWACSLEGFLYRQVHSFSSFWRSTGFLTFFTAALVLSAAREVSLRRFARRLRQGIPQVNRKPYGRSLAASAVYLACSLYWVFASFMVLGEPNSRPFSPAGEFDRPVPYVTAEALGYTGHSAGAEALRVNNWLTAEQWWVMEDMWVTEKLWEDGSRNWLGRVNTEYCRMRLRSLAEPLARSMAEQASSHGADLALAEDPGFGLEGAYLGRYPDGVQTLICWREGQVIRADCRGDVVLRDHLADYAALLAAR